MAQIFDYRRDYVVYPDGSGGAHGGKAPYIDHGAGLIPPERYYSQQEADLEWDRLWTRVWCFAGLTHDLKTVGDYFQYTLGRESFIVVRSSPDSIKAFFNVCPHRANWLVYDNAGHIPDKGAFYCKFRGWRFNIDGSTREIKDEHIFRKETICDLHGLKEVRCEVWNSLVFINMDSRAMPLAQYLDVIPGHLRMYPLDRMPVYSEMHGVINSNWKVGLEAFIEFYHADDTHPQVLPLSATLKTQYDLYDNGMSRMIIPLGYPGDRARDPDSVTEGLKGFVNFFGGHDAKLDELRGFEYRKAFSDTLRKWADRNGHGDIFAQLSDGQVTDDWNYHLFPTITLNMFSWGTLIQSWTPHPTDPEKHVYRTISLLLPVKDPEQHVMDPISFAVSAQKGWTGASRGKVTFPKVPADWGTVLSQDMERIPKVQEGIRSRSYEGHRLCESESRLRHYLAEVDRYLGRGQQANGARESKATVP